ncbi:MAG TPA: peptide ABC transporter substrate-binding protein [Gemmatimonadales bacterium]|nr:peptide ABC transporter substrate-binding protein [Gemmatimonadales bacterium]
MTSHRLLAAGLVAAALLPSRFPLAAQRPRDPATLAVAYPRDPSSPIPTLWRGDNANRDVSDLMFLRLADLGPQLTTIGDKGFVPRLARKWERRDPLTLVFELDPRARWHDGKPVTAADVLLGFERARNPRISAQIATLLRRIQSVTAEGERRVVVKFTEAYPEQLYDAVFHALPLPAHLLAGIPAESLATSNYAAAPVGNGPYRFVRRVPAQVTELAANTGFFLGKPKVQRVLFLVASDAEARANLILSGTADAIDNIYSFDNPARLEKLPDYQYYPVPGLNLIYLSFNQRDPSDTSKPHPILSDPVVRRALVLAADRQLIARATYGPFVTSPGAPLSAILGRSLDAPPTPPYDTAAAKTLLASRGWIDHNGDGIRDKDGVKLSLSVLVPAPVAARKVMATRLQEAYRGLGIELRIDVAEQAVYIERHDAGRFDLDFYGAGQDPSPSGLTQTWTCAGFGGSNVSHYCNPVVDSLIARATVVQSGAPAMWRDALRRMADDYPAIFMAALVSTYAVHRRFENVRVVPGAPWSAVWQWGVRE